MRKIIALMSALLLSCELFMTPQVVNINDSIVVFAEDNTTQYTGSCGENATWSFDAQSGILTINGTGDTDENLGDSSNYWQSLSKDITKVVIDEGITSIGSYAFKDCNKLSKIYISPNVTSIGTDVFPSMTYFKICGMGGSYAETYANDNNISFIDLTSSYTGNCGTDATYSFDGKTSTLTISGKGKINNNSFEDYSNNIKKVIIEDGITSIGFSLFNGYPYLESVELPNTITYIGMGAFDNTPFIETFKDDFIIFNDSILYKYQGNDINVTIPNGIVDINPLAFKDCSYLQNVTIPDTVKNIYFSAFINCKNLKELTIPNSVTHIDSFAFGFSDIEPSIYNSQQTIKNCYFSFNNKNLLPNDDFIVKGENGSVADSYAKKYQFKFYDVNTTLNDDIINKGYCGENATWVMDKDYNVTISGTGTIDLSILPYLKDIENYAKTHEGYSQTLTIEEGITGINLLQGFEYVKTLEIPKSVSQIGNYSLIDLDNLQTITVLGNPEVIATTIDKDIYIDEYINITNTTNNICGDINISCKVFGNFSFDIKIFGVEECDLTVLNSHNYDLKTIYGVKDSYFEQFANDNNIEFIDIENPIPTETTIIIDTTTEPIPTDTTQPNVTTAPIEVNTTTVTNDSNNQPNNEFCIEVLELKKYILGISQEARPFLDFTQDGNIDTLDLIEIKNLFLG